MRDKTKKFRGKKTFGMGHNRKGSKPRVYREPPHGFKRPPKVIEEKRTINIGELDQISDYLIDEGIAKEEQGLIYVDLADMGVAKVLGSGQVTKKFVLNASEFSETAKVKLEKTGGKVWAR
ncbi:MAG: uL15 family ribosomal protein [Methanocellales archaeon]|nr:uL15 family ribosomal protein [Methanocellales archaeon]MDD3291144.1 uL15 family ribosomal protein [Methanocellales archaeon]MDD5235244.1 uL15 family ribosomal protein [Methanocellales archaeon]MDD5484600.1 uL15 family ribosomal protein [Methanocellales archaeon]